MKNKNSLEVYKEYRKALKEIYNSPQGKIIFDYLEKVYVEASCFDRDTNTLVYRLANKELIQHLIYEATTKFEDTKESNLENEYGYV